MTNTVFLQFYPTMGEANDALSAWCRANLTAWILDVDGPNETCAGWQVDVTIKVLRGD